MAAAPKLDDSGASVLAARKCLQRTVLVARVAGGSFMLVGLLVIIITATPFVGWYARVLSGSWCDCGGETLIVLSGSTLEEQIIGASSYWRAVYALRAYRTGRFRHILLSGLEVSMNMRDFLVFQGVPADAVTVDATSRSTRESALRVSGVLAHRGGANVLLSSDYHMLRARRAFEKAGLHVSTLPAPDAIKRGNLWYSRWSAFTDEVVETAKIGYYAAKGWI
jgi:uncharacterized SAM-binding protein YcdF (DUF218 family)